MDFKDYLLALSKIKNMCDERLTCEGCVLYNEYDRCKLAFTVPRHWEVE